MKKGAATMISVVISIMIMIFLLTALLTTANNEQGKKTEINLQQAEVQRLANTFALLNKSLEATWQISAIQTIFKASGQSLLCGEDALTAKYFYRYDKSALKRMTDVEDFISADDSAKYNTGEPRVCYVSRDRAAAILESDFSNYLSIPLEFNTNGIKTTLDKTSFKVDISVNNNGVEVDNKQKVKLTSSNGIIDDALETNSTIYTEFPKMIDYGRKLIDALAYFSDYFLPGDRDAGRVYEPRMKYQDLNIKRNTAAPLCDGNVCDTNYIGYLSRMQGGFSGVLGLDQTIRVLALQMAFKKTNVRIASKIEFLPAELSDAPAFGKEQTSFKNTGGLLLHYDYAVTLTEGVTSIGDTGACSLEARSDYLTFVQAASFKFMDTGYSQDEAIALISGIIQQESSWNNGKTSPCGAAGFMQLEAGTARDMGLRVYDYAQDWCPNEEQTTCILNGHKTKVSVCNHCTPNLCVLDEDERFNPQKSIDAGSKYLHQIILDITTGEYKYSTDHDEVLKLALATYNAGPGTVKAVIERAIADGAVTDRNDVKYEQIAPYLPQQAQDYVPAVLGHFVCYGGSLDGDGYYYYHNEDNNKFTKRPFAITMKAEDYLPAIDCGDQPYIGAPGLDTNEIKFLDAARFFAWSKTPTARRDAIESPGHSTAFAGDYYFGDLACCGGKLWSCGANIEGLDSMEVGAKISDIDCNNALNSAEGPSGTVLTSRIYCTSSGFVIVQSTNGEPDPPAGPPAPAPLGPPPTLPATCAECLLSAGNTWCTTSAISNTQGACISSGACPDIYPNGNTDAAACVPFI